MSNQSYITLQAFADPTRLRLLSLIDALPGICVCQLMEILKLPQTTTSKALGILKKADLVVGKRDKQWVQYWINHDNKTFPLTSLLEWARIDKQLTKDLNRLKNIRKIPLDKICCNKPWRIKS